MRLRLDSLWEAVLGLFPYYCIDEKVLMCLRRGVKWSNHNTVLGYIRIDGARLVQLSELYRSEVNQTQSSIGVVISSYQLRTAISESN